jgi:hypothetical protein
VSISELRSRDAVLQAIAECDRVGRSAFLRDHGFRPARDYMLIHNGQEYDSKAIAGVAYGYQFPERGPLRGADFVGGRETVSPVLTRLGFTVRQPADQTADAETVPQPGQHYSWEDLGAMFGFRPAWLGAVGGMAPRPEHDAVLLITHPGGGKSFDYADYWDGKELIYTGRGRDGPQVLEGANRDVADNRRRIFVFENVGPRSLRCIGQAHCVDFWPDLGPDRAGVQRRIYRFRLSFSEASGSRSSNGPTPVTRSPAAPDRRGRPFDRNRSPSPPQRRGARRPIEETLALLEKATRGHHGLLAALDAELEQRGWLEVEEVRAAIDLRGRPPGEELGRVIFEGKTLGPRSEAARTRAGLAQLLEYRFLYGEPSDELCLVVTRAIADERIRFLRSVGVEVIWPSPDGFETRGEPISESVATLLS